MSPGFRFTIKPAACRAFMRSAAAARASGDHSRRFFSGFGSGSAGSGSG
jgi:hypothetical protein